MAEGLAREMFGDLVQVSSAGMQACDGESASTHAVEVLKEQNIDISGHRSRRIRVELMAEADWIMPMTQAQETALWRIFPEYIDKTRYLGGWKNLKKDVLDPWGGTIDVYRQTAHEIGELLSSLKAHLF